MVLNKRERQILQVLVKERDHYVTSQDLAKQLKCSDRTIRTYYKSLVEKVNRDNGVTITSKQGYGYRLKILDDDKFSDFLEEHHFNLIQLPHTEVSDIDDRYSYLLNKLLFEQNKIYFDDLADELYVSRSTLSSDFKKIREKFIPYHLTIESKPNKGVYVTGSERDKRRFIMDYFINSGFVNTLHNYVDNRLFSQLISFEELTIIVLDECREGELKLSDFVIQNLVIHIALAIRRITEGFKISKLKDDINVAGLRERHIAKRILKRIGVVTKINFPEEEIDYITLHLATKKQSDTRFAHYHSEDKIRRELLSAIDALNPNVKNDIQLIEGLLSHLSTMRIRLENDIELDNPLAKEIKSKYLDMFQLSKEIIAEMPSFRHLDISDDEMAYIALHFMAAKERYKENKKYNVLVICATGYGSAQMLKSRLENELGNFIKIIDVIGYYEINDEKLKDVDVIISSIDLSSLIFNVPVYTVSVFLDEDETNYIRRELAGVRSKNRLKFPTNPESPELITLFDEYFSSDSFFILDEISKDDLLDKLVESISDYEGEHFKGRMKEMIAQRELMSTVVFSDTIAVPHPLKAVGTKHRIAVAIIPEGIQWNADYPHIKFVFLTSMSVYDNDGLPTIASAIVDLVDNPHLQEQMLSCQDFNDFKKIFLQLAKGK